MLSPVALILALGAASVSAQAGCSPLHFVYARATTELPTGISETATLEQFTAKAAKYWSKGYGAAGASLWFNLSRPASPQYIPGITGFPVNYPASMGNSASIGIKNMVDEIKTKSKSCQSQRYVLGGHSQGGMVTVGAIARLAKELPKEAMDRIIAVTMFGSPKCPQAVANRCKSYCHKGDFVCDPAAKGAFGKGGFGKGKGSITPTKRSILQMPQTCLANVQETGFIPRVGSKTGTGPHLSYNADGYMIKAAACYINERYKAGGAASVAPKAALAMPGAMAGHNHA